jgi:hypothetical protein
LNALAKRTYELLDLGPDMSEEACDAVYEHDVAVIEAALAERDKHWSDQWTSALADRGRDHRRRAAHGAWPASTASEWLAASNFSQRC